MRDRLLCLCIRMWMLWRSRTGDLTHRLSRHGTVYVSAMLLWLFAEWGTNIGNYIFKPWIEIHKRGEPLSSSGCYVFLAIVEDGFWIAGQSLARNACGHILPWKCTPASSTSVARRSSSGQVFRSKLARFVPNFPTLIGREDLSITAIVWQIEGQWSHSTRRIRYS